MAKRTKKKAEAADLNPAETPDMDMDNVPAHLDAEDAVSAEQGAEAVIHDPAPAPTEDAQPSPSEPTMAAAPAPAAQTTVVRKGGTGAMLLGGALAAGLGYGASEYLGTDASFDATPIEAKITAQAEQIAQLQSRLAALAEGPDLSGLEQAIADSDAKLSDGIATVTESVQANATALAAVDERLTSVELRGQEDGSVDTTAITAYERELKELRDAMAVQSEQMTAAAADASARLEALEADAATVRETSQSVLAEAEAAKAAADQARTLAAARSGLSQVETALAQGGPFAEALDQIRAVTEVPEALAAPATEGVITLAELKEALPAASRTALNAARDAGESGEEGGGRVGSFLRNQFEVRSTEVQDGNSANAVLSRIGAAVSSGDLTTALSELDTLPTTAQEALSDWAAAARTRAGAVDAAQAISQILTEK